MTSTSEHREAFVWAWLPGAVEPVVAGLVRRESDRYRFAYGQSYLARPQAISLYGPELPLEAGWIEPRPGLEIASCLRDAGPDSWGQRVILERLHGVKGVDADTADLDQIAYFLESGSNRVGGLDFQVGSREHVPRGVVATLDQLHAAADAVDAGDDLEPVLADALLRGTSIGGARPKALLERDGTQLIAKFSSTSDRYPVVKAEALGFDLARRVGIAAPASWLTSSLGKDVLIMERFDRSGGGRRIMVSALTMLGLPEHQARYSTYPDLLEVLRRDGSDRHVGRRLFERIVFNIAIGNNDDHARNHAAFWDGERLELTPAYDLCPQVRSGETSNQAMAIDYDGHRDSAFRTCLDAAGIYGLSGSEAADIIDRQVETIEVEFDDAAEAARLTRAERNYLRHRQILNPATKYGYRL